MAILMTPPNLAESLSKINARPTEAKQGYISHAFLHLVSLGITFAQPRNSSGVAPPWFLEGHTLAFMALDIAPSWMLIQPFTCCPAV
jgi:hypothetical protein